MEDISLHIMDIVDNSLRAGAQNIHIHIVETPSNLLTLEIEDDGTGMNDELLENASNPFFTTKEGKKFGLGLSLLSQACTDAGGSMTVQRGEHGGVKISAIFMKNHVDMKPMGNIEKTIRVLKFAHPNVNIAFQRETAGNHSGVRHAPGQNHETGNSKPVNHLPGGPP